MDRRSIIFLAVLFLAWKILGDAGPDGSFSMSLVDFSLRVLAFLVAVTLHELGHALVATWLGDPTPRAAGRLTLNPLAHLDPLGTLLILLVHFGYAKPVPVNPVYFKKPGRDSVLVAFAGPAMNILLLALSAIALQTFFAGALTAPTGWWSLPRQMAFHFLLNMAVLNAILAAFNLLPIPPLDGSHLLDQLLPPKQRYYYRQNQTKIAVVALALLLLGFFDPFFRAVIVQVQQICLG